MDIASTGAALAGIKSAIDIAKVINDSGALLEHAEIKFQLADLISKLADAKIEIANIREAAFEKENQIKALNKKLELKENIVWQRPYYFTVENGKKNGPYCQSCYDSKQKLIRLQGKDGLWQCHQCGNTVMDDDYDYSPIDITPNNDF